MQIHAFAAKQKGGALQSFAYTEPELLPFEVLIEVTHCGLCHSDLHLIDDDWTRSVYPLVPGHEVVGNVVKKGAAVSVALGTRVGLGWLCGCCLECPTCLSGDNQLCLKKKATCIGHHGGFADKVVADSRMVFPIPEALDSALAAPLLCAGATVYSPLKRWKVQAPQSVAVIGIGGLGHIALQFAAAFGCDVTAISSTSGKEKEARSFGANRFLSLDELKTDFTNSFDFILSTVHADLNWNQIVSLLKPSGTLCFLGRPHNPISLDIATVLSSQRNLCGSTTANRFTTREMLLFAARHKIAPKIELFPFSKINEAIEKLRKGDVRYRIVLTK